MVLVLEKFQTDSHSKNTALWTIKLHNLQSQGGGELLKVNREKIDSVNAMERKHKQAVKLLKILLKKKIGNENIKEGKPNTESKRICICAPATHEGSFKCRFHRIGTVKKP
ncbi:uncharacterized protein LOC133296160 [Gastrolobium bilobum]|uniref:uncharacterized protein LOC133296160 n=1 Tax=Gastrolobium bilobum TaxID=150636 RepID=UPI002AB0EB7F|nr:uncharacterized protein LOC133296160 [Gastrolobium bilobum]